MPIDDSGEWWRGTDATDIDEYVREYNAGGYPIERVLHATCAACGESVFHVRADGEQGYVERTCRSCQTVFVMLDSADVAGEAEPEPAHCPCGQDAFEVAVGYAYRQGGDVRWVSIGTRCIADGVLGVIADWKIDYSPTVQLLSQA